MRDRRVWGNGLIIMRSVGNGVGLVDSLPKNLTQSVIISCVVVPLLRIAD